MQGNRVGDTASRIWMMAVKPSTVGLRIVHREVIRIIGQEDTASIWLLFSLSVITQDEKMEVLQFVGTRNDIMGRAEAVVESYM